VVELKTAGEIAAMREAGRIVARALAAVRDSAEVGVRLTDLDEVARGVLKAAGASSPFLHYRPSFANSPYPAVICTSVNDAVLHGIPGRYQLSDGDLLGVDCGATLDGWTGDAAITFTVGRERADNQRLIQATEQALAAGIKAAVVGARIGDISAAIGEIGRAAGCGISTDYGGHGVGRTMHEAPSVPNEGRPGRGMRLLPGLVIAIEPWFMGGGNDRYKVDRDGWTLRSTDGSRGSHSEHTVAVTEDGPAILTEL
jgi:methionyl aminopeptidase